MNKSESLRKFRKNSKFKACRYVLSKYKFRPDEHSQDLCSKYFCKALDINNSYNKIKDSISYMNYKVDTIEEYMSQLIEMVNNVNKSCKSDFKETKWK